MRLSDEREGDALAMLDTARVAEMSLEQLSEKYGPDVVEQCVDELMDRAEETMRDRITELADGDYYYEQYMDSSGLSPDPLPIRVKLTIDHDTMTIDFTGTTPQVVGPMNVGLPVTHGGMFVIVKSWLDPKTPVNGGTFRPLKFIVPAGSCLAAELLAAVGGCWDVFRNLESSMIGLLAQVIPDQPAGESQVGINHCYIAGYDPVRNRPYIMYEYPQGGTAATGDTDGKTAVLSSMSAVITSVESPSRLMSVLYLASWKLAVTLRSSSSPSASRSTETVSTMASVIASSSSPSALRSTP